MVPELGADFAPVGGAVVGAPRAGLISVAEGAGGVGTATGTDFPSPGGSAPGADLLSVVEGAAGLGPAVGADVVPPGGNALGAPGAGLMSLMAGVPGTGPMVGADFVAGSDPLGAAGVGLFSLEVGVAGVGPGVGDDDFTSAGGAPGTLVSVVEGGADAGAGTDCACEGVVAAGETGFSC